MKRMFLWGAVLVAVLVLRLPSLNLPLDPDEGEAATLAWTWSQGHGVPYKDYFELKPPAPIGVHAVAQKLFSDGVVGLRWLSLVYTLFTVLGLMLLVLNLGRWARLGQALYEDAGLREKAALWTGLCAAILMNGSRTQALAAQPEAWQALPLLAAVLLLNQRFAKRWSYLFAAGLALGVASFYKQPVVLGVLILPWSWSHGVKRLRIALGLGLGILMAWSLLGLSFASHDAAQGLWDQVWAYGFRYSDPTASDAWRRALGLSLRLLPSLGVFLALGFWGWSRLRAQRASAWLTAWLVLGLASVAVSGRYYPHYAIILLAPLSVAAGLGLALLGGERAWLRRGALTVLAFSFLWTEGGLWSRPEAASRAMHVYGLSSAATAPTAAERLQRLCPENKRLLVWGSEPQLYYLARRAPASRFIYIYPFTGEAPPVPGGEQAMLSALYDPRTGAVALSRALDVGDPIQAAMAKTLEQHYEAEQGPPPFVLGKKR